MKKTVIFTALFTLVPLALFGAAERRNVKYLLSNAERRQLRNANEAQADALLANAENQRNKNNKNNNRAKKNKEMRQRIKEAQ